MNHLQERKLREISRKYCCGGLFETLPLSFFTVIFCTIFTYYPARPAYDVIRLSCVGLAVEANIDFRVILYFLTSSLKRIGG